MFLDCFEWKLSHVIISCKSFSFSKSTWLLSWSNKTIACLTYSNWIIVPQGRLTTSQLAPLQWEPLMQSFYYFLSLNASNLTVELRVGLETSPLLQALLVWYTDVSTLFLLNIQMGLSCFVFFKAMLFICVASHHSFFPYPSELLHWHWDISVTGPVHVKQLWKIWIKCDNTKQQQHMVGHFFCSPFDKSDNISYNLFEVFTWKMGFMS